MSKITRTTQQIFGVTGNVGTGGFGAAALGNVTTEVATSNTLATIMGTAPWGDGWISAVLGATKFPALEDMNALDYAITTQLAYLLQQGIAEYDAGTTYYISGVCVAVGTTQLYKSLTNANLGNALTSTANWQYCGDLSGLQPAAQTGTNYTYLTTDAGIFKERSNSGTVMADTLAGTGTGVMPKGWTTTIANTDASAIMTVAAGSGASLNGVATGFVYISPGHRLTFVSDGSNYWTTTQQGRLRLKAATTFYVATTGSDTANTGLTSSSPFLTLQAMTNFLSNNVDMNGFTATIQIADGTYTGNTSMQCSPTGNIVINGNVSTPSNVVLNSTSGTTLLVQNNGYEVTLQNLKVTAGGGDGVSVQNGAVVNTGVGYVAGAATGARFGVYNCGILYHSNSLTIIGNGASMWNCGINALIVIAGGILITLSGTLAFTEFAYCDLTSTINFSFSPSTASFSGSATGTRYSIIGNSIINTNSSGSGFLPGNASGTTASGGLYL